MFWVGSSQEFGRTDLVVIEDDLDVAKRGVNAKSYLKVLQEHLPTILGNGFFMQDNAPIHTAKVVKQWSKTEKIQVSNWPPYSLDLNLMENLCGPLKNGFYTQNKGLLKAQGTGDDI